MKIVYLKEIFGELSKKQLQYLLTILLISLVLNIALWLLALFAFPQNDSMAILHYSAMGVDFVGQKTQIIVLPLIGSILFILNLIFGMAIFSGDRRASWLIWSVTPVFQFILLSAFYFLWKINS